MKGTFMGYPTNDLIAVEGTRAAALYNPVGLNLAGKLTCCICSSKVSGR
jgi:hypothetical protein